MDSLNEEKEQGVGQTMKVPAGMNFEQSKVDITAEMALCDPTIAQAKEDEELLKEVGDSYTRTQKGKIISSDGETTIETDLHFTRTRNKIGGVDVLCVIPALGMSPDNPLG